MRSQPDHPIRDHLHIYGPAILLTLLGFLLAYQFVQPAPPDSIRMSSGGPEGAYHLFAEQFAREMEQEGITLQVSTSGGSVDNIGRLERGEADIAFVQGGTAQFASGGKLRALGSLYFEPVWLFHRRQLPLRALTGLYGKRIAVGGEGSGTAALANQLMADNGINSSNTQLLPMGGREAADALLAGEIDAAFFVASPKSPVVRALLDAQDLKLMDFRRAEAYTRIHRYLSTVELPRGVVSLQKDLPRQSTTLLATTANLVIREDLHPALVDLLLQAAEEIHGKGGWFEDAGQFPAPRFLDFPLSKEARRHYDYGPPLLQRYLPFWAATLVDRLKVMLLPLLALLIPLFKIMPPIYRWRVRSRIYRWYREVLAIDRQTLEGTADADDALKLLGEIEREVAQVNVPLSFAEELYDLRLHIELVRDKLRQVAGSAG